MENILQCAPETIKPLDGAKPFFKQVSIFQDAVIASELLLYQEAWSEGKPTKTGSRLVKMGTADFMDRLGMSRSSVFRLTNELMKMQAIRVVEREQPAMSEPRTIEVFSMAAILKTWRSLGWSRVVRNRGKHFVDESGKAIELAKPKLPELIRRAVEKVQKLRKSISNRFLGSTVKAADPSAEKTATAAQTEHTQEPAAAITLDELRKRLLPKAFVHDK